MYEVYLSVDDTILESGGGLATWDYGSCCERPYPVFGFTPILSCRELQTLHERGAQFSSDMEVQVSDTGNGRKAVKTHPFKWLIMDLIHVNRENQRILIPWIEKATDQLSRA
jgi:hypothetical protein